jgi:hypothetical protein
VSVVRLNKSDTTIDAGSNASFAVNGDRDVILIGEDSSLIACGAGLFIDALGTDDIVIVGGNGAGATTNVVTFHAPGTLRELAHSSVEVNADYAKLTMVGDDTLSVYGVGDSVYAAGLGDRVSIGGNGAGATGAEMDVARGLANGSLLVFEDSAVWAAGANFSAEIAGHDTLTALGHSIQVCATGDDNTVAIGGDDEVVHMNGGVVNILKQSSADIFGDNLLVRAFGFDAVSLTGADDRMVLGAFANNVTIGQDGNPAGGLDIVQFAYTPLVAPVTVLPESNVRIAGSHANVTLDGGDQVTLIGYQEQIIDQTGNNHIVIGGNGSVFFGEANNYVTVAAGDTVSMLANSNLTLFSAGTVTDGQYAVHMSSQDALSIDSGMTVYVPVAVGADLLVNFGSTDVLQLASHFLNVNDLLAHATEDSLGRTVLQLDAGTDTLTLGMDKATFTTYAQEGLVKFH